MAKIVAPEPGQLYHGVYPAGATGAENNVSPQSLQDYLAAVGRKKVAWVYFSHEWRKGQESRKFPADTVAWIKQAGAAPYIRLMLRSSTEQYVCEPLFTLEAIAGGEFDCNLEAWGKAAADSKVPLLCEWGTEMNGMWFPWNAVHNGGPKGPALFKDAFRRVVQAVRNGGGKDVTWVYHVNHESSPAAEWNALNAYDPGPDFSDWVGVSLYGAQVPTDTEADYPVFSARFQEVLEQLKDMLQGQPVMVSEFGFTQTVDRRVPKTPEKQWPVEPAGKKAATWARDALESFLSIRWPEVRGFSWWNEAWENEQGVPATEMRVQQLDALKDEFRSQFKKYADRLVEAPIVR
jgi:Glycosyl hydrolase family 26